jgi:hypothetical protein
MPEGTAPALLAGVPDSGPKPSAIAAAQVAKESSGASHAPSVNGMAMRRPKAAHAKSALARHAATQGKGVSNRPTNPAQRDQEDVAGF